MSQRVSLLTVTIGLQHWSEEIEQRREKENDLFC